YRFKELLDKCYEKNWVTYCKETFNGAQSVINYLGKYTHRIAISNQRIKSMKDTTVTYAVKDYKNEGCWKEKTISGEEFIRRFLMHVPPKQFVRIRHYGLLSCRNKRKKITHCRNLLGCKKYISTLKNLNAIEMIKVLYHIDVCKCSSCGGNMVSPRKDKYSSSFCAHMRC
ncbi:transposase, partial [Blautia wexlerae]